MKYDLLNELVEEGYDAEDLDELYEFVVEYILEYEELVEQEDDEQPKDSKAKKIAKGAAAVGAVGIGGAVGYGFGAESGARKALTKSKKHDVALRKLYAKSFDVKNKEEYNKLRKYATNVFQSAIKKNKGMVRRHKLAGAGIGGGLTAAGIGAKALHNRYKNKKENS